MDDAEIIPINTDRGGLCRCIKANYYKMGWTNFTREALGAKDGFAATAIIEVSSPPPAVKILGYWSPTSQLGGRVFDPSGISPSIMAGTHGYGFGCILLQDGEDNPNDTGDVR